MTAWHGDDFFPPTSCGAKSPPIHRNRGEQRRHDPIAPDPAGDPGRLRQATLTPGRGLTSAAGLSRGDPLAAIMVGQPLTIDAARTADLTGTTESVARAHGATIGVYEDVDEREHQDRTADSDIDVEPGPERAWHDCEKDEEDRDDHHHPSGEVAQHPGPAGHVVQHPGVVLNGKTSAVAVPEEATWRGPQHRRFDLGLGADRWRHRDGAVLTQGMTLFLSG
jgi:hypothetical protein